METNKRITPFWKKHFLKITLSGLLVISLIYGYFSKQIVISKYEKQFTELKEKYSSEIEDLNEKNIKILSYTLALAIRSELINENLSQIDQYLKQTVKLYQVERIILVDHKNANVILSTNKKDEDSKFEIAELILAKEAVVKKIGDSTYSATPIMGLNTQLSVLIIQID